VRTSYALALLFAAYSCERPTPADACDLGPTLTAEQCTTLKSMVLPETAPVAYGNPHADNEDAALLGFKMFFDARFSSNGDIRCATCHQPESRFHDGIPTSKALGVVPRNSPSLINASRFRYQFWDGRADSVWSQALFAFEAPNEMNFSRVELARAVRDYYGEGYVKVFGALPDLADTARFPAKGKPGDPEWAAMTEADRTEINRVAANVGKALEAYQRKLTAGRSPFDRYLLGDDAALNAAAKKGLVVFAQSGCLGCHSGPMFSDEGYHNLWVPLLPTGAADRGRADALAILNDSPFTASGPFYEGAAPSEIGPYAANDALVGAFKTPSLRNVALGAPYGHNGRFETLEEMIDHHVKPPTQRPAGVEGALDPLLQPVALSAEDKANLVEFLRALNGSYPQQPWSNWPHG
jgi:cytochrome c peroxidase